MQQRTPDISDDVRDELAELQHLKFWRWQYDRGVELPRRHDGRSWLTAEDVDFLVSDDQAVEEPPDERGYAQEEHYSEEGCREGGEPPDVPPGYAVAE